MRAVTSEIVQFNVPAHIRESNPDFISFLKHYYAYAEQEGQSLDFLQNLVQYRDIDTATDFFADLIVKQYLKEFPTSSIVDKRLLSKHIREFFEAKGSFPSYEFLINSLFGENIEREWMTEHVLRPSANEWIQTVELLIKPTQGDYTKCIGSRVISDDPIAVGFITDIQSKVIDGEQHYVLTLDHKKIINQFKPYAEIRILKNDVVDRGSLIDADYYYGIVQPCQSTVVITNPGALYSTGQKINFIGGNGIECVAVIGETVAGKIESANIELPGLGYVVGDQITDVNNGTFAAHVTSVDGIGADISPIMELHSVVVKSGGYGYQVGDVLEAKGLPKLPTEEPLLLEVASVDYTWKLLNIRIDNTGTGYSYTNLVLYDETDDLLVPDFNAIPLIGTGLTENAITNYVVQRPGGVYDILSNTASLTLANHTYSVRMNGFGASVNATLSGGQLTGISLVSGGWNYQDPIVRIVGNGYGAVCSITKDVNGTIDNITIDSAGNDYTVISITIEERLGGGALLVPILQNETLQSGEILTVNILNRGEFSEQLVAFGVQFESVTGSGTGFTADLSYRLKDLTVNSSGGKYSSFRINTCGCSLPAVVVPVIDGGSIVRVDVVDSGSGYASDSTMTYYTSNPIGSDAILKPIFSNGHLVSVTVIDGGSGYTEQTNHLINEDDFSLLTESGLTLEYATLDDTLIIHRGEPAIISGSLGQNGSIVNCVIDYGGSGLSNPSEIEPMLITMVSNTGYGCVLKPVLENGRLIKVHILSAGIDYSLSDTAVIVGSGTGAAILPIVDDGQVIDIQIVNQGSGYQYGTYAYVYGAGDNAELELEIETGITDVEIIDRGSGYTETQTFSVSGGSGAEIRLTVKDGQLDQAYIVKSGSGYNNPTVTMPTGELIITARRYVKNVIIKNPGTGYVNPKVFIQCDSTDIPVIHTEIQNFDYSVRDVKIVSQGYGYTILPIIEIVDNSGNGAISGIDVTNPGRNFFTIPQLTISSENGAGGKIVAITNTIGQIRQVRFNTIGLNYDEISKIAFPTNLILTNTDVQFKPGEKVLKLNSSYRSYSDTTDNIDQEDGFALLAEDDTELFFEQEFYPITDIGYIHSFDYSKSYMRLDNTLDEYFFVTEDNRGLITEDGFDLVDEEHESLVEGDVIIGETTRAQSAIAKIYKASGYTYQSGINYYNSRYLNDSGKPNVKGMRIHNNERFQDFAYVLSTPLTFSEYEQYIKNVVHPAGYRAFTDVALIGFVDMTGIRLPDTGIADEESSVYIRILTTGAVYPYLGYEFVERNRFEYNNTPMNVWGSYTIGNLSRRDLVTNTEGRLMIGRQEAYIEQNGLWVDQ